MRFYWLKAFILICAIAAADRLYAQDETEELASELSQESMIGNEERPIEEEDGRVEALQLFRKRPLNLNTADQQDLETFPLLNALQIQYFLQYRRMLGPLLTIYELQSVPFWDTELLHKIREYIIVEEDHLFYTDLKNRLRSGEHQLSVRLAGVPEKSKGYLPDGDSVSRYIGSPLKSVVKYRYTYKNLLQYGFTAEKDAGEPFLKGPKAKGFDFYSMHFFIRKSGIVKALALGDYSINMGQGLILWQGMGFGKGVDALAIKRQAPILKPYHSLGEYYFQRGTALLLGRGKWESLVFLSARRLDAVTAETPGGKVITSIITSGYHRTPNELLKKSTEHLLNPGISLRYRGAKGSIAFNAVNYRYSHILLKRQEPYNLFAPGGSNFHYMGTDYQYTYKNVHFFGEWAVLNSRYNALTQGLLASLDKKTDFSMLYRHAANGYSSLYANAFTENTLPGNERGLYAGISFRPSPAVTLTAYADIFYFPWLKYRVDNPSYGKEWLVYLHYRPDKKTELSLRYRYKSKTINLPASISPMSELQPIPQEHLRIHIVQKISSVFTIRTRAEISRYDHSVSGERGSLFFADLIFKPLFKWSGSFRIAFFDTDGYNSRVYMIENDGAFGSSLSTLYTKGSRYFLNLRRQIPVNISGKNKRLNIYLRWSQSIYNQQVTGSGLDEIGGNRKSEFKVELNIL